MIGKCMAAGASDDIQVWLFTDDRWPPQTLVQLYAFMQADRVPSSFWRDGIPLSLNAFVRWLTEPGRYVFLPVLCSDAESTTLDQIIGMALVDEIELPKAAIHFWVRKKFWWRRRPLAAARKALALVFREMPGLQLLTCRMNSHNRLGVKFMKQVGVRIIGEIPNWYKHGDIYHPATFGYIPRADVEQEVLRAEVQQCQHLTA